MPCNISLPQDKTWMSYTLLEWLQNYLQAEIIYKCLLLTAKIKPPATQCSDTAQYWHIALLNRTMTSKMTAHNSVLTVNQ